MKIITIGQSGRLQAAAKRLAEASADRVLRLVLLPVPTSRDKIHVTGTDTPLTELLSYAECGTLFAGYSIPEPIAGELTLRGAVIYDAALDESFLRENAEITADGAVGWLLTSARSAPRDLSVGIVGYGRIGSALLSRLLFLGASVGVVSGSEKTRLSLCENGIKCSSPEETGAFRGFDILINTAPAKLISEEELSYIADRGTVTVDLASGKFLPEHPSVTKLSSVPDAMYPTTAGRIYAEHIARHLD